MHKIAHKLYWTITKVSRSTKITRLVVDYAALYFFKIFRKNRKFTFNKKRYKYFYHIYNRTVASERVVEIPIAVSIIEKYKNKRILEMGNVLSHYIETAHDVLDKYELAPGVINEDVVDFRPKKKYDLIISVSTMEHVGWTYGEKKDSRKFLKGLKNIKSMLKKGGFIVVTFPVGYRKDLTNLIKTSKMPLKEEYFMKRVSYLNEWKQVSKKEALKGDNYEGHFANANVLYIGMEKRK